LENVGVDGQTILTWIFMKGWVCVDLLDIVQDRDKWWAVVSAVMNLRVP
jgi:hypothetical protein